MANVLPHKLKKKNHREYHLRFLVMIEVMIAIVFIFSITLVLPSYGVSLLEEGNKKDQIKKVKVYNAARSLDSREIAISNTKEALTILEGRKQEGFISGIVDEILRSVEKSGSIIFSAVSYDVITTKVSSEEKLIISGVAETRNDLLLFTKTLEESGHFSEVVLPVSNLKEQRNIDFSLSAKILEK